MSVAHLLIKASGYWVAFNEYGAYLKTDPYISDKELRDEVIQQAIERAQKLVPTLVHK